MPKIPYGKKPNKIFNVAAKASPTQPPPPPKASPGKQLAKQESSKSRAPVPTKPAATKLAPPAKTAPPLSGMLRTPATPPVKPAPVIPLKTPAKPLEIRIGKVGKPATPAPKAKAAVPLKAPVATVKVLPMAKVQVPAPAVKAPPAAKALGPASVPVSVPAIKVTPAAKAPAPAPALPLAPVILSSEPKPKRAYTRRNQPSSGVAASGDGSKKRVLFITAECSPLAQSGGLGDAAAGLAKALHRRGHDVRIVMPLYRFIDRARFGITYSSSSCVHFGEREEMWIGIYEGKLDGEVPIWFVDYARYFDRGSLYGDPDDAYRFGVLSKGALQICKDKNFIPHIAHVHDWMSSMAAVFLKTWDRVLSPLSQTASVLTIHNIGYQGKFDPNVLHFYGLGGEYLRPDRLEDFGAVNLLKAGIQYADAITTVSPTYAREIREPVGGMGLAPYLNDRADHLFGIVNGVDTSVWNPATDKLLPATYTEAKLKGKGACKRALQEKFGLAVDPKIPIFAVISRFAPQKGFELLRAALPAAMRDMVIQFVGLGTGDPATENFFRWLASAFPGRANAHIGFAPDIAHLIEAGSDFFLMPSIYEPCGLNQMYSSLYGSLPVVRATGGLEDTVENYNEAAGTGTGFKFWDLSDTALYFTMGWAVSTWYDRPLHYRAMQRNGMTRDFSWAASAREYEKVYEHALAQRRAS